MLILRHRKSTLFFIAEKNKPFVLTKILVKAIGVFAE
jgi:hypothetical protein